VTKKGFGVWLFSTLTVIAAIHLIDAANALLFDKPITLLRLYPLEEAKLQAITPTIYFLTTAASTLILWGITCAIAFENPVEAFLNKILSDAKKQSAVETQLLEEKSEILDAINETVEMNSEILAHIRDLMYNVRAEIKEIQPLGEELEKIRGEVGFLKKEIKKLEERMHFPVVCLNCGKTLPSDFNICPYCGENLNKNQEKAVQVRVGH
jgi:peptidoglycan hydrolase CwlO-like protein